MPEIELGIVLRAYDRTEGVIAQLATDSRTLQGEITGLGTEMAKGGTAGREAAKEFRDLSREIGASDKAATLAAKAWEDQHEVMIAAIDVGDKMAKTVQRGIRMATDYNVASIRVTQAEEAQVAATQRLETAKAKLAEVMAKEPENAEAVAKATADVTKAQEDLDKATKGASAAQNTMNLMLLGFAAQAPAFAKDFIKIGDEAVKFGEKLMLSKTFGPIFSGEMGLMEAATAAFNAVMEMNPVVLILGAIAAAAAALYLIWDTNFLGMRDSIQAFWDGTLAPVVNSIMDLLKTLWEDVVVPLGQIFVQVWNGVIGPVVKFVWDTMIAPAVTLIIGGFKFIIDTISGVIQWIHDLMSTWESWNPQAKSLSFLTTGGPTGGPGGLVQYTPGGQVGFPYGVPHTGLYRLHEGETVNRAGSSGLNIGTVNVYASDYPGGRAAGKGFLDELRRMGVYPW